MSLTFLTWNLNNQDACIDPLLEIINNWGVDIVLLNESGISDQELLNAGFKRVASSHKKCKFYSKLRPNEFYAINDTLSEHINFCCVKVQSAKYLIGGVHLPSKLFRDELTQASIAMDCMSEITQQSTASRITEVILFGDFNMNPFELGMTHPKGFNNVSDKRSSKKQRTLNGIKYSRYYNPTYSLQGDFVQNSNTICPPGSFLTNNLKSVNECNWNILDNVILKGNVVDEIDSSSVQFIYKTPSFDIFDLGTHKFNYSDHLPLLFKLNIQ